MIGRVVLVLAAGAAGAFAALTWLDASEPPVPRGPAPAVRQNDPEPGSPPVVWVSGTLERLGRQELEVREGAGPAVAIHRFPADATTFHGLRGGEWVRLAGDEVGGAEGEPVCVEALLDGPQFFALRVFVGAACSPAP